MCNDCKYAIKDGKRLICMCESSAYLYDHVSMHMVCDEYEPYERQDDDNKTE